MIDFGLSQKYTLEKMEQAGVPFSDLRGALITHLHSDHTSQAMSNKLIREQVPIYCQRGQYRILVRRFRPKTENNIHVFAEKRPFEISRFTINAFKVPHDAPGGCYGFNITQKKQKITIATDLSAENNGLANHFTDSNVIVLESNYDPQMLENSGRPANLIQRIQQEGHLSNAQSAAFLNKILKNSKLKPQALILAHLSQECNSPLLAKKSAQEILALHNLQYTKLVAAEKKNSTATIEIRD